MVAHLYVVRSTFAWYFVFCIFLVGVGRRAERRELNSYVPTDCLFSGEAKWYEVQRFGYQVQDVASHSRTTATSNSTINYALESKL